MEVIIESSFLCGLNYIKLTLKKYAILWLSVFAINAIAYW